MADRSSPLELQSILTSTRVGELRLVECLALTPEDTLADAARAMRSASHGCAVVCEDGKLVGIFTERDLLRTIGEGRSLDARLS
ncbi:MAG: CBS domain-containing protein, partial [Planctomycetaceae bacterium]